MAIKVNLKKYLKLGDRWQFIPVLKVNDVPKPAYVVINGEAVKEAMGVFSLEWRLIESVIRFPTVTILGRRSMLGEGN